MKKRRGELGDIWSLFVVPSDSTSDHVPVNSYLNEITMFLMLVTYVHAYNQNYIPLHFLRVNWCVVCAIPIHQIRTRPTVSRFEFCIKVWRRRWEKTNSEDKLGFGHHHHSNIVFRNRPSHVFALLFKAFLFFVVMGMTLFSYFSILTFSLSDHIRNNISSKVTPHTVNQAKEVLSYPIHIDKHIFRQTHALALEMSCTIEGGGYKAHSLPPSFFSPKYGRSLPPSLALGHFICILGDTQKLS